MTKKRKRTFHGKIPCKREKTKKMECNEETISSSFHFESKESIEVVNEDGNNISSESVQFDEGVDKDPGGS